MPTNAQWIADELSALLERTNEDAYVIFEHAESGKFVQFAGGAGDPLLLDLPSQALSEGEFDRAVDYFRSLGHDLHEYDVFEEPGGKPAGRQASFQMALAQDVERATKITLEIFSQVFELPENISLRIDRN